MSVPRGQLLLLTSPKNYCTHFLPNGGLEKKRFAKDEIHLNSIGAVEADGIVG